MFCSYLESKHPPKKSDLQQTWMNTQVLIFTAFTMTKNKMFVAQNSLSCESKILCNSLITSNIFYTKCFNLANFCITIMSHEYHDISNHCPIYCLFNSLIMQATQPTTLFCTTGPLWGESIHQWWRWPVDCPHKVPSNVGKFFHVITSSWQHDIWVWVFGD